MPKTNKDSNDNVYKFILELSKESYLSEEKREQSILTQASQMVTVFSIMSVFVLGALSFVATNINEIPLNYLLTYSFLVLIMLFGSLVLAILAQWRYNYEALPSPCTILSHISSEIDDYKPMSEQAKSYCSVIDKVYQSKLKNNNKRAWFIRCAMILFYISLSTTIFAIINAISIFV